MNRPTPATQRPWPRSVSLFPLFVRRRSRASESDHRADPRALLHSGGRRHPRPVRGVPGQLDFLPRFTALILASVAYESVMLGMVSRAIQREGDLPGWVWSANAVIEALLPTITLILLTESPFMGPYRALGAPATHGYYIFIILSTMRLRPSLCFLTGLASAPWLRRRDGLHIRRSPGRPGFRWPQFSAPGVRDDRHSLGDLWHDRCMALQPISPERHRRAWRGGDPRPVRADCA